MKKQILLFVVMLLPVVASAHDIEVKNAEGVTIYYKYINDGTELEVTCRGNSYSPYSDKYKGNIVIPEEVTYMNRTRKVTSIDKEAFRDCIGLTSIVIPNSVKSIEEKAFKYCIGLTSVTIPNSVTNIDDFAFQDCTGFTSITIPNSVTSIGASAFAGCTGLTSVTIGSGVTSIGEMAFVNCYDLISVKIDASNTKYDSRDDCNAIIETASNTFVYGCKTSTIPNGVTSIGKAAFQSCYSLTSITIPNSVTSIGASAFYACTGLTSITIPNSVTSIGNEAFGALNLTSVTIPNSVTSIGDKAFVHCEKLTSVTIGNSVTSIGASAFYACAGLTSITIPNSVTSIGASAFLSCTGLTSVTIGSGVTSIGNRAFDLDDIPTIISLIENPFTIIGKTSNTRTFTLNTFNNATLYVPTGTIEEYKATGGWKDIVFIEEGDINGIANITAKALLIKNNGGQLIVEGTADGETISVYTVNGVQSGSAISQNGAATVNTTLQSGSVAIVKIGQKSVKVIMK